MTKVLRFQGMVPRRTARTKENGMAEYAMDVNLSAGTLKPWQEPLRVGVATTNTRSFFMMGCDLYTWNGCIHASEWVPNCPRLYITGSNCYPEVALPVGNGALEYYRLGVPSPDTLPVVNIGAQPADGEDTADRAYVFTYVNVLDEESGPSYPSSNIAVTEGQPVTVSGWAVQPAEWGVVSVRLYRRVTGFRLGDEKEQQYDTGFVRVAEFSVLNPVFIDSARDVDLGGVLDTKDTLPPPDSLQQILLIDGTSILVGYSGNKLYFSEDGEPHSWPMKYEMTLDHNVVSIGQYGGILYVATDGAPYVIDADPGNDPMPCRAAMKSAYVIPAIACPYVGSYVVTPFGFVYATIAGLVLLKPDATLDMITEDYYDEAQWRSMRPDTARLSYYRGWLICSTETVTFMMVMDPALLAVTKSNAHVSLVSVSPRHMQVSRNGEVLMLLEDGVYQWNAGHNPMEFTWSGVFVWDIHTWVTSMRLGVDDVVDVTLVTENGSTYNRDVASDRPFRMPRIGRSRQHMVTIKGSSEVSYINFSGTFKEEAG